VYRIRPWLYVGKYRETIDLELLRVHHIGAMLLLAENAEQPNIESLYLAIEDGEPLPAETIKQGVEFVRAQKAAGKVVLVACGAGISRSVTFAIAALKEEENLSLVVAYRSIQINHPYAMPHPALWESLRLYYNADITFNQMWEHMKKVRGLGAEEKFIFPTLETARLMLRGLETSDVDTLHRLSNHHEVSANLSDMPYPYPREAAEGLVKAMRELGSRGETYGFAITPKSRNTNDTLAGMIYLILEAAHQRAELIYWLGREYWNRGYATEAAQRVLTFGFEELKLNRIHASYFTHNPASARVLQKIGMKYEGIQRQHLFKNGEFIDLGNYGLLRSENGSGSW
jgi:RimJ/RimL family protein N-acetyltransferase